MKYNDPVVDHLQHLMGKIILLWYTCRMEPYLTPISERIALYRWMRRECCTTSFPLIDVISMSVYPYIYYLVIMSYKGRYIAKNPKKYKGDSQRIIYRSLWERKFMVYCDTNESVIEWGSEEIIIPYLSPWDGRIHRYFPDFYIKINSIMGLLRS